MNNNELKKKIQNYSYKLNDIIGKGYNSIVYKGINENNQQPVAIKVINLKNIKQKNEKKMLQSQIQTLKKLNHSNTIKLLDVYSTVNNCYIITQFCNQGDLKILIKKRNSLPEEQAIPIIRNIIEGFRHITELGILHRNLKLSNLLLNNNVTKISSFSFAKFKDQQIKDIVNDGLVYKSIQVFKFNKYSFKSQIWSIGIIIYQILHGKIPWISNTEQNLMLEIPKTNITMLSGLSQDLKSFIRKCLLVQQQKRISIKQFFDDPFVIRICQKSLSRLLLIEKQKIYSKQKQQRNINNNQVNGQTNKIYTTQKQFQCHINWMRFLYKLNALFPNINLSGSSTLKLKFIINKQLLSQLYNLKLSLSGQNIFNLYGWSIFINLKQDNLKYNKVIDDYIRKYQKNKKQFNQLLKILKNDKKLAQIMDNNFIRTQNLSIFGINAAVDQIKGIWTKIQEKSLSFNQQQLPSPWKEQLLRLDFIITYYQLNCILIQNFANIQQFRKNSKLQYITDYKPQNLGMSNLKDIQNKINLLQLIK